MSGPKEFKPANEQVGVDFLKHECYETYQTPEDQLQLMQELIRLLPVGHALVCERDSLGQGGAPNNGNDAPQDGSVMVSGSIGGYRHRALQKT